MASEMYVDTIAASDGTSPATLTKQEAAKSWVNLDGTGTCLLYTSPSPRDVEESRMPSSA